MNEDVATHGRSSWTWSRTGETKRGLRDAALEVFVAHGYAGANVSDIVERANSSVGSLYHHFGGKKELWLALWNDWMDSQERAAAAAVTAARREGETRSLILFMAGARGYLENSWKSRTVGSLFFDRDGPPGFESLRRERHLTWLGQNAALLGATSEPVARVAVATITSLIGEASREIMACKRRRDAVRIMDAVTSMVEHVGLSVESQGVIAATHPD